MKIRDKLEKYSGFASLTAGLFFVFTAFLSQWIFISSLKPENIKKKVEAVLHQKELSLSSRITRLEKANFSINDSVLSRITTSAEKDPLSKELSFYIYERDTLVFWSDNSIPVPEVLRNQGNTHKRVVEKIGNCWVEVVQSGNRTRRYIGLIRIKQAFPFENEYLKNDFYQDFPVPSGTGLSFNRTGYKISSSTGEYLFSLKIPTDKQLSPKRTGFLFVMYFIGLLFLLVAFYRLYLHFSYIFPGKLLFISSFILDLFLFRFLQFHFRFPAVLYYSDFFGPGYFSSSAFMPSLGDVLVNSLLLLFGATVFYKHFSIEEKLRQKAFFFRCLISFVFLLVIFFGGDLALQPVKILVMNSTIPFDLQDISGLNGAGIIGFFVIGMVFLSFFLFALVLLRTLLGIFSYQGNFGIIWRRNRRLSFTVIVCCLVLFSMAATIQLNKANKSKEREKRMLLALKLGAERDPVAEMMYSGIEQNLLNDTLFDRLSFRDSQQQYESIVDSLRLSLRKRYFGEFWNNYSIQITFCKAGKELRVQPQNYVVDCNSYFHNILTEYGKPTLSKSLFYLDYGYGYKNYLGVIPITGSANEQSDYAAAYIEISSKLVFKDLGYPELLVDKGQNSLPDVSGYSYAFYRNGSLVHRVGNYHYAMVLDRSLTGHDLMSYFYSRDGQSHYCNPIDEHTVLIISKKESSVLDKIAPFSYLLFVFSFLVFLFLSVIRFPFVVSGSKFQLGDMLQIWMTGILFGSLIIIGGLSINYIVRLNAQKNKDNLSDRAYSILVELQHKLGDSDNLKSENTDMLPELLTSLSNVFFTDINVFSVDGRLLATSRPQIYEEKLISERMNNKAFNSLGNNRKAFLLHKENIGDQEYYSAYLPFYNDRNKLLGYLNVPAFAKQEDLKKEISSFLVTFINSYIFIIILGIFLSLIVSNYIIRPLRMLTGKIGALNLESPVEKLEWKRKDEIGRLVDEYNRMTVELAKSAELLAKSERESAWREMARQIAHEIKNPLTPMKLSVQYLEKAWKEKAPDWEIRLARFTATMIEQIELLSAISSEFSDFAQMPAVSNEQLGLNDLIEKVVGMYRDSTPVQIEYTPVSPEKFIMADRKQLIRVFTNLINNSLQAIGDNTPGIIRISVHEVNTDYCIEVADNGSGIDPSLAERIFQPNFTTKSSGSGLGLAIVKSIIVEAGGTITCSSVPGDGTVFKLTIPGKG